jgi:type III restriction enzyme
MLELLDSVEEPTSKVRILVSVGMLKEGWDVKNVYVICSLCRSISDILTEQTLGRGLRLPFGHYTDEQLLDTLEVIAHERYEKLLKDTKVIDKTFIDVETRAAIRVTPEGAVIVEKEKHTVGVAVGVDDGADAGAALGGAVITDTETREAEATAEASDDRIAIEPRKNAPTLRIPVLKMEPVETKFSLNDITNLDPFRKLGEQLAESPEDELRRDLIVAELKVGEDGLKEVELSSKPAEERVSSAAALIPLDDARDELVRMVLASPVVPPRPAEKAAAKRIVDELVKGLGVDAASILSRFLGTIGARLIRLIVREYRKYLTKPTFEDVVEILEFTPVRYGRPTTSANRKGDFKRNVGYTGWSERSYFEEEWFDSKTERDVANILDESDDIDHWVRLQRDDLPILWSSGGSWYHPDFIAVDTDGVHWIVEAKSDRDLENEDVQAKREATKRWANHVSSEEEVATQWRYLLVSEDDVKGAKGDWRTLKGLGQV